MLLLIIEIQGWEETLGQQPISSGGGGASIRHRTTEISPTPPYTQVLINPGDVYIDKFTDKFEYNKGDPIRVIIKVHAVEPREGITFSNGDVYLYEELYSWPIDNKSLPYDLIGSIPSYESFKSGELIWHFKNLEDLIKLRQIEYTIKTNKSGFYYLGNSRLESMDKIIFSQSMPQFIVYDNPPIISNVKYPYRTVWQGDANYIECSARDPDKDNVTCELYYNNELIPIFSRSRYLDSYNFTWDLSLCEQGNYIFKIKASDGNSTSETDGTVIEIKKRMFNVLPYNDEYKIPVFTGVAVGLILSGVNGITKRFRKGKTVKESGEKDTESIENSEKPLEKKG